MTPTCTPDCNSTSPSPSPTRQAPGPTSPPPSGWPAPPSPKGRPAGPSAQRLTARRQTLHTLDLDTGRLLRTRIELKQKPTVEPAPAPRSLPERERGSRRAGLGVFVGAGWEHPLAIADERSLRPGIGVERGDLELTAADGEVEMVAAVVDLPLARRLGVRGVCALWGFRPTRSYHRVTSQGLPTGWEQVSPGRGRCRQAHLLEPRPVEEGAPRSFATPHG